MESSVVLQDSTQLKAPIWPVTFLLSVHLILVAYGGWVHSPCWDEVGHFAAGLHHWHSGDYQLYKVNPPLVRMWATLPVSLTLPAIETAASPTADRGEFALGQVLIRELGPERTRWAFAIARWTCLPFTVLGALVCWHWARRLFGVHAGLIALALWCFDPNILANAQMITPDTGATAFGLLACYLFWEWCEKPDLPMAGLVGMATGLALLCKFTWVVLAVIYPLMWICQHGMSCFRPGNWLLFFRHASLSVVISLVIVNAGYRFDGSGTRLGDFHFTTKAMSGTHADNRFRETSWKHVPVPLPREFVLGIDRQRRDFESGFVSYLRGEWKHGGWWYYYLYGLLIKSPLGTLLLWLAAIRSLFFRSEQSCSRRELAAIIPGITILAFVSSQTGFNHHLRYVLPAFPFLFIFGARVVTCWIGKRPLGLAISTLAVLLAAAESLSVYPHCLSFFNLAIGGPRQGHNHLVDSNIEWGQDLFLLREWMERHPDARPMWSANWGILDAVDLGCPTAGFPPTGFSVDPKVDKSKLGPLPGWYAVGVAAIHSDSHPDRDNLVRQGIPMCGYLNYFEPVDRIGYSMLIYHLTPEDVAPVRTQLGLPAWSSPKATVSMPSPTSDP